MTLFGWIAIALVATALIAFFVYRVTSTDEDEFSLFDEEDIEYGDYLSVYPYYLHTKGIDQYSSIQVSFPLPSTPAGNLRVEINHLTFTEIPISKVTGVHRFEEDTKQYKERNKHRYEGGKIIGEDKAVDNTVVSVGLFDGDLGTKPDQYSQPTEVQTVIDFGSGGEFAGGGASGSWMQKSKSVSNTDNNHTSTYEPASHQSNYGSQYESSSDHSGYSSSNDSSSHSSDSSSSYDSGSSSYDSRSSDTSSSSGGDSW